MRTPGGSEWERGALIGRGAFGSVFLAHPKPSSSSSRLLPPVFAVKSAEILCSATLENEIEVFNNLQVFPYIITCYGDEFTVSDKGETVYNLFLEYASGGSLADRIEKSISCGVPVEEVKRYTKQLLLGLAHMHDSEYVHCDIKPDNILLLPSGDGDFVAKISDFGLSKEGGSRRREFDGVRGTPLYMAPEMVVDGVQDCASDIWAVGCVVYEMLTGYSVWPLDFSDTIDDLYHKIAGEEPYLAFWLPNEAEAFLRACFVRTPAQRPTAKMLLEHTFLTGLTKEEKTEGNAEKVSDNGCQQVEAENCCVTEEIKVIENGWVWEEAKAKDDCEEEEEDPEELEEVGNDTEEEEEDPEEEVGSSCLFEDDRSFVRPDELMLFPCSLSKNDGTLPACKRRRISHLNPITGGDTLAPTIAAGM